MHQPGDALEERTLAGTICTDDSGDLAGADAERNAEECLEVAIEGVDGGDLEQRAVRHRRQFPYRFQYLRATNDAVRVAAGDEFAAVQDHEPINSGEQSVHDVLDPDDRNTARAY